MKSKIALKCIEYLNDIILLDEPLRRKNQKLSYIIACFEEEIARNKNRGILINLAKNSK